jgi:hypothetical protein
VKYSAEPYFAGMFRNEDQFKAAVARALQEGGYTVRREVGVRTGLRLDFLATRKGTKTGIEAKFGRRGLNDDLVKSQRLARLPEVDEMYFCAPKIFMSDDVRALAGQLGVGLLALRDDGKLEWLAHPRELKPSRLSLGGGYKWLIKPGEPATYNATVFNSGDKAAVDIEVHMVIAAPFIARHPSKTRAKLAFLDGHGKWNHSLACDVKRGTKPGKYSLLIRMTAANLPGDDEIASYEIAPLDSGNE